MSVSKVTVNGSPLLFMLFVVFLALKLTETIDWTWWIVTMPLWIGPVIVLGVFTVVGFVWLCALFATMFVRK